RVLSVIATIEKSCTSPQMAEQMLHQAIANFGRELAFRSHGDCIEARLATTADEAVVAERCRVPFVIAEVKVKAVSSTPASDARLQAAAEVSPATSEAAVLRIEADRVDRLLDLAGEL